MEKAPHNTDILDWYVDKLYKKALDHCLQQQSTTTPTSLPSQDYTGHIEGHSKSNEKRQGFNATLNCDLLTCSKPLQKDGVNYQMKVKGQSQVCRSGKGTKKFSQDQPFCEENFPKNQQSSRLSKTKILSERYPLNGNAPVCEGERTTYHTVKQGRKETENHLLDSVELGPEYLPNIRSSSIFYRQSNTYRQQSRLCSNNRELNLNHVLKHDLESERKSQLPIICLSDDFSDGKWEKQENEIQTLKPHRMDWFSHSVLPRQTYVPPSVRESQSSYSKDDTILCHSSNINNKLLKFGVSDQHSPILVKESKNMNPCQHSDFINLKKNWSQSTCSHKHFMQKESGELESTCPHQHSVKTNAQFHPSAISNGKQDARNFVDMTKKTKNFKSSIFFNLKSNHHSSDACAKNDIRRNPISDQTFVETDHFDERIKQTNSGIVESEICGTQHLSQYNIHSCDDVLERNETGNPDLGNFLVESVHHHYQTHVEDISAKCIGLQNQEKAQLEIPPDQEKRMMPASGPLTTQLNIAALEEPVCQLSCSCHDVSFTNQTEPAVTTVSLSDSSQVVSLTCESLKLHDQVLSDAFPDQNKGDNSLTGRNIDSTPIQDMGDHSFLFQDKIADFSQSQNIAANTILTLDKGTNSIENQDHGTDSDSGDSCKSGIVIKPGHLNQKRKRSLSLDKDSNKRPFSGTYKESNIKPAHTKRLIRENKTSVQGNKACARGNKTSSRGNKTNVRENKALPHTKRCRQKKSTSASKKSATNVSKKRLKKKNVKDELQIFDASNKKIDSRLSDHSKRCIGREISILQAHQDQAMTDTDSVCPSSDSNRLTSLAFLELKDLVKVPDPCKSLENQSVYMSRKHVGGVWNSIVKK